MWEIRGKDVVSMSLTLKIPFNQKNWEDYKNDIENLKKQNKFDSEEDAIAFARTFCHSVIKFLWNHVDSKKKWKCRKVSFSGKELDFQAMRLAKDIADYFITLNIMDYAYLTGNLYTALLPNTYRSDNGIYYTPPTLAERLLDLLTAEGADWAEADILDPACGGGAFLITIVNRILGDYRIKELPPAAKILHIENHLAGIELDGFAAWITQSLLDIILYQEAIATGRRLRSIIKIQDTIQYALYEARRFDVIVGNPPYGKVKLDGEMRDIYSRSLYGHANLYGLFIDASLRLKKENGIVGFVTPTSFLGGKYFSNLRNLLAQTAPPLAIDFVAMRNGVFEQVLQETCLVVFGQNAVRSVTVNKISIGNNLYNVERVGNFKVELGTDPWIIAREPAESQIVNKVIKIKTSLKDYGYKVSTGQLVWNRLKEQISEMPVQGSKPIIWAEAISAAGNFDFNYQYRSKKKYITVTNKQDFLICDESVVLVQRTTAKEQDRRLQTCILPQDFIDNWHGVVVENHVNIIHPITEQPRVTLKALSLILNTKTVDRIFRCLSGSVAVSATELHAIPLPPVHKIKELEALITVGNHVDPEADIVERIVMNAYGLED